MPTRRRFLTTAAASTAGLFVPGRICAASGGPVSFFFVSDTHYRAADEDPSRMMEASTEVNRRLIDWLNRLPGSTIPPEAGGGVVPEPMGVIHGGDIIDSGDKGGAKFEAMARTELDAFLADWGLNGGDGRLRWPVREVHGNHDSPHGNGLHYSWDWGNVHFVAVGIVAGDSPSVPRRRRYAPMGSLPFLESDLAERVGTSGRPVVIVHHIDVARYSRAVPDAEAAHQEWDYGDVKAYHDCLSRYRIAAILFGHTHVRNLLRWDGTPTPNPPTGVPALNTDNAAHFHDQRQALLHLEADGHRLRVREFATTDAWRTGTWTPSIWDFPLPT